MGLIFTNCENLIKPVKIPNQDQLTLYSKIDSVDINFWHLKDIINDTIPGISLERAQNTILSNKKGENVIIAVLDTKIGINHKEFTKKIWTNLEEIANNNLDDDGNGFIDDINGWNFLGNSKGESVLVENYEYVRIVRQYKNLFEGKEVDTNNADYLNYKRAKLKYESKLKSSKRHLDRVNKMMAFYYESRACLKEYFPDYNYSYEVLNKIDTVGNGLKKYVEEIKSVLDYKDFDENMEENYADALNTYTKKVNINYVPRKLIGDDPNNIDDSIYGNNQVNDNLEFLTHGTRVSGVIAISTNSEFNTENKIKIMPLSISAGGGSRHDKDIAIAIKYAVNNGAKVINLSSSKVFSLHPNWVCEAIKYAEKNNVLIVTSAGNSNSNIDDFSENYPNDDYNKEIEFCDNLLVAGASSSHLNEKLKAIFSNYGITKVDVFAPGQDIYTTYPNDEYQLDSGSSLSSALVAKVAALLFSNYPNLTASQVKHIIMDSGVEYTFPVKVRIAGTRKDTLIPFNQLSKSGKIVNAYNALIMADSISKAQ